MKAMWGATQLGEINATRIAPEHRQVLDERFRGWAVDVVYPASTFVRASGQADCKTKMDAIATALETPYQDLKFLNDDGSSSHNSVLNSQTLGGTRCVNWKWEPEPRGAQFTTGRFLSMVFEYRILFTGLTDRLLDFSETVTLIYPEPKVAENEAVNTAPGPTPIPPEIIVTVPQPASRAIQQGWAVGATGYPDVETVAPDLFSGAGVFRIAKQIDGTTPKYRGADGTEQYRVSWRKEFVANVPLIASPNPWPSGG